MTENQLLAAAREGDEAAFVRLVDPHRGGLYTHCYRMLGSPHDAEDALQEALLRAWRGLARFQGRSSLKSWLYRIATNASLRAIERRPQRVLPIDVGPAADPHDELPAPLAEASWVLPLPDAATPEATYEQRESVELAFIAALQLLPARQRAVLILREVLGFSGDEVAEALDTTPASVYSALQRAHRTVDERLPAQSQQSTLRTLGDAGLRAVVDGYVDAWERGDVSALAAMLTDDATFAMPPHATWFHGRDAIASFLARVPMQGGRGWPAAPTWANGQLAFAHWRLEDDGGASPHSVSVLTLRGERIEAITAFLIPALVDRFGVTPPISRAPARHRAAPRAPTGPRSRSA
jgi:RNA polymerase sigma-70 factor, ECF subfamily